MAKRDVVVIGASAGGIEALTALMSLLPQDFGGAILVVVHVPAHGTSVLPKILGRVSPLEVRHAESGDELKPGRVLVAPPDRHLVVHDEHMSLSKGPKENGCRPAVDVLFRSAASALGARVTGVVLSGALDDGAAGAVAVKLRGGKVFVQDPEEALYGSMPRAAAAATAVDGTLRIAELAARLVEVTHEETPLDPPASELMEVESAMADMKGPALDDLDRPGTPSGFSCPDCNGSLFEIEEGGLTRYRCRVGHAWSPDSLVAEQATSLEGALWTALRTLEEKAALSAELGRRATDRGHRHSGGRFEQQAREAQSAAQVLRELIENITEPVDVDRPVESGGVG